MKTESNTKHIIDTAVQPRPIVDRIVVILFIICAL